MERMRLSLCLGVLLMCLQPAHAQLPAEQQRQWKQMHDSKGPGFEQFNEAKFGLFIHWGLYSQPGGEWKGEKIPGLTEWIMYHAVIPRAEYRKLAETFNPVKFDAEAWVKAAKDAGMRYLVVTSKHHDGFALYRTNIARQHSIAATPFSRDPIDDLYRACKKHGLRFGVYYSQIIDWLDGWDGGMLYANRDRFEMAKHNPMNTWDPVDTTRERYLDGKAIPQVRELIRKYPDMLEVWFDYWYEGKRDRYINPEISYSFYKALYDGSPQCLVSTRIGNGLGDFAAAGDNEIPEKARLPYWETPGTMNNTWGYSKFDNDWKSPQELLFWLVDIASKGGNYLLNIGPKADGSIPEESLDRLAALGRWTKINGESIYGTRRWLVDREGNTKPVIKGTGAREKEGFAARFTEGDFWFTAKQGKVYVNAFTKPAGGVIQVKTLAKGNPATKNMEVNSVRLLGYSGELKWKQTESALEVQWPKGFGPEYGYCLEISR
jgi:alpha-L-fucosidase